MSNVNKDEKKIKKLIEDENKHFDEMLKSINGIKVLVNNVKSLINSMTKDNYFKFSSTDNTKNFQYINNKPNQEFLKIQDLIKKIKFKSDFAKNLFKHEKSREKFESLSSNWDKFIDKLQFLSGDNFQKTKTQLITFLESYIFNLDTISNVIQKRIKANNERNEEIEKSES